MQHFTCSDPIVACSSGMAVNSAVSLIRISGFEDIRAYQDLFSINIETIKPRYAYYCNLVYDSKLIDQIVLTFYKGPNSYNGENILELGVHGNLINVERIISLFNLYGTRVAAPGEFTYRALRNKKMSLSQVEGLDLLLNAGSVFSLDQGFSLMSGKFQKDYLNLQKAFLNHKSAVELSIDFLEDIGEEHANNQFHDSFNIFLDSISKLKRHINNEGLNLLIPEIALIGLPNAGKSSLFNAVLAEERSIVTNIAGTTRDYISERVKLNNVVFALIDTAGVRDVNDQIEAEGISRSISLAGSSFYKILVVNPFDKHFDYFQHIKNINFDLIIFSHSDHSDFENVLASFTQKLSTILNTKLKSIGSIEPENVGPIEPESVGPIEPKFLDYLCCNLNCLTENDLECIENKIFTKYQSVINSEPVLLDRHKELVNKIYLLSCEYQQLFNEIDDISIISSELNSIGHCISELIGIISPDDVLHNIFDNFCIGK